MPSKFIGTVESVSMPDNRHFVIRQPNGGYWAAGRPTFALADLMVKSMCGGFQTCDIGKRVYQITEKGSAGSGYLQMETAERRDVRLAEESVERATRRKADRAAVKAGGPKPIKESTREAFREAVLAALDETVARLLPKGGTQGGATDADLPELFRAIDAHTQRLVERHGACYAETGDA